MRTTTIISKCASTIFLISTCMSTNKNNKIKSACKFNISEFLLLNALELQHLKRISELKHLN